MNDPLSEGTKHYSKKVQSSFDNEDDDSIFGDLDEESVGHMNPKKNRLSKVGMIVSTAETEDDIFAGVSVSSRNVTRLKEMKHANHMKSLLDGSTTTGSHSLLQKTAKTDSKEPEHPPPKVQDEQMKPMMGLFMMDGTYGVIDVTRSGERSHSGASVTSDITSSVIGDFGKMRLPPRKGLPPSERGIPESIVEVDYVLSNEMYSPSNKGTNAHDFDKEDTENVDPQGVNSQQAKESLNNPSNDETTHQNKPSLWKKALSMARSGGRFVEEKAAAQDTKCAFNNPLQESKCAFSEKLPESVGGIHPAAAAAAVLLLPFAPCAIIGASSYAFCATKGKDSLTLP